jgi:hypothetical protein
MPGELILLPVRLYFRAARFALRTSLRATEQAVPLATDVIRSVTPDGSGEVPERPATNGAAAPPLPGRNSHALTARGGGRGAATEALYRCQRSLPHAFSIVIVTGPSASR